MQSLYQEAHYALESVHDRVRVVDCPRYRPRHARTAQAPESVHDRVVDCGRCRNRHMHRAGAGDGLRRFYNRDSPGAASSSTTHRLEGLPPRRGRHRRRLRRRPGDVMIQFKTHCKHIYSSSVSSAPTWASPDSPPRSAPSTLPPASPAADSPEQRPPSRPPAVFAARTQAAAGHGAGRHGHGAGRHGVGRWRRGSATVTLRRFGDLVKG